jgi:osmoprotectant transport system permease protein
MQLFGQIWDFVRDPSNDFIGHTHDYLQLCLVASVLAIAIAVPLGIVSAQNAKIAFLAANVSGLARAVPTVAFFAYAVVSPLGIGFKPAVIALTILGIPPVLLNTIAGLNSLDVGVIDSARGMGMTTLQNITRVQIPLVLPVIAAGTRTAVVQIVATAPLAALIGAGGYGDYIIGGLALEKLGLPELYAGIIPVVILAMTAEFGLAAVQHALTPRALRESVTKSIEKTADVPDQAPKEVVAA